MPLNVAVLTPLQNGNDLLFREPASAHRFGSLYWRRIDFESVEILGRRSERVKSCIKIMPKPDRSSQGKHPSVCRGESEFNRFS
jgi:hypothetical protein